MRWVRSTYVSRLLAGLLIASMLPVLVVPDGRAATTPLHGSFERWVRAQLRDAPSAALESALDAAAEAESRTFGEFVEAFVRAYEELHPQNPASRAFTDRDLTNDALISYLQRRYTEVAAAAVLPRLQFVTAGSPSALAPGTSAAVVTVRGDILTIARNTVLPSGEIVVPISTRGLNPARPQGP